MIPRRSRILDTGVRATFHTLLLLSLFLLFRGHNQPGGGFAGGLVAGAALVLLWVARGPGALTMLRITPEQLVAVGLLVAVGTGIAGLVTGGELLESGELLAFDAGVLGHVRMPSVLVFDLGVFLLVLGFVTLALEWLGDDDSRHGHEHDGEHPGDGGNGDRGVR